MGQDKVTRIMQELAQEKNRNITLELAELKKRRDANQIMFGILTEKELHGLAWLVNKENKLL